MVDIEQLNTKVNFPCSRGIVPRPSTGASRLYHWHARSPNQVLSNAERAVVEAEHVPLAVQDAQPGRHLTHVAIRIPAQLLQKANLQSEVGTPSTTSVPARVIGATRPLHSAASKRIISPAESRLSPIFKLPTYTPQECQAMAS